MNSPQQPAVTSTPSVDKAAHGRVLVNFVVSIAASWIASPLGVLFLHYVGYGADRNLVSLLLSLSAAAPFQLLCNEYLAASACKANVAPSKAQFAAILGAQMLVTFIVSGTFGEAAARLDLIPRLGLCALLGGSTWLSYAVAVRYYGAALGGNVRYRQSILIGAIPGLVTLAVYLVSGMLGITPLILLAALAPAIVQLLYARSLPRRHFAAPGSQHPSWILLIAASILLGFVATANALVRGEIGFLDQHYVALILTGLNLVGTVVLLVSRAGYLMGAEQRHHILILAAAALCLLAIPLFHFSRPIALLVAFLGLQLSVAAIIANIRQRSTSAPAPQAAAVS